MTLLLRHIAAVAMNVIGVPDTLQWGREAGRDGTDGTVVTTCSSITIKKSNVTGMAERNPQFVFETIERFVESMNASTLQFLENNSAVLLMMVRSMVQGADGLTEEQVTNEFNSAVMAQRNPQFAFETIEHFVETTHASTLHILENDSALLLMMVQRNVQGAQGLTEQQIRNQFSSALSSRLVAVGLPNPADAEQEEVAVEPEGPPREVEGNPDDELSNLTGSIGSFAAADSVSGGGSNPSVENFELVPLVNPDSHLVLNDSSNSWSDSNEDKKPEAKKQKKK